MIVGLEGIHTAEGFTLNDLITKPRAKCNAIVGLRSLPEMENVEDKAMGRTGGVPRRVDRGGKTITFEGSIECWTLQELREFTEEFGNAFASTDELEWESGPHPDYEASFELPTRRWYGRVISNDIGDEYPVSINRWTKGYEAPFSTVVRMSDPRFYHMDLITETDSSLANTTGTGGIITPDGETDPAETDGLSFTTNNLGKADTDGIITIEGHVRNPVISNETLGVFLRFRDLNITATQSLVIDFKRRTVRKIDGGTSENVRHKLDAASTWWDQGIVCLAPGNNDIRLRGYNVDTGPSFELEYYPADWN